MKQCPYCGSQLADDVNFCTNCGGSVADVRPMQANPQPVAQNIPGYDPAYQPTRQEYNPYQGNPYQQPLNPTPAPAVNDSGSIGWAILGFLFPIVGFILWLLWKDKKPQCAQKAIVGAAISFGLGLIMNFGLIFNG